MYYKCLSESSIRGLVLHTTLHAKHRANTQTKQQQKTLRVITIAIICSTLALLWKFHYFWGSIYTPVENL